MEDKHEFNEGYIIEALDRIHVIQTMLDQLLLGHEDEEHLGLSEGAKALLREAEDKLAAAYQAQGNHPKLED